MCAQSDPKSLLNWTFCHNVSNRCCIYCTENIFSILDIFSNLPCLPSSEFLIIGRKNTAIVE